MFRSARQKLENFQTQRDQLEIQIKKLISLENEDLVPYAAGLDIPGNQVTHYFTQYRAALESRLTLIAKGLGPRHPDIIAVEKRAQGAMKYARKEAVSLKEVLKTKLQLIERQIERMSEMINNRQGDMTDLTLKQKTYTQAKEAYEQSRTALREMKTKYHSTNPPITEVIEGPN